jgi:hypothetical protein
MFQIYIEIISFSFFYSNANMSGEDSDSEEEVEGGIETVKLSDKEDDKEDAESQVPTNPHEIPPNMTVGSTSVE